ncbi:MAG: beta-ketoacyl synthase chain length factor [Rubrivivax sp.]|nr:beta-ketoacyl synthase chain length factor [Rubrivivax sp.]
MSGINFDIRGIGLLGPGLADWASAAPLLRDPGLWRAAPTVVPAPQRLPATERRRAGPVVKASIVVADQAVAAAGLDAAELATVFASSSGEPTNCHALCAALAAPERLVSPTRFTNSVHNAPGGYWHIAVQSQQPSTSLAAFDASFGAGLLEAAALCATRQTPVLLVVCDVPFPEPLHAKRPLSDTFGLALVLVPGQRLSLTLEAETASTTCDHAALEAVRSSIPAARALPLLQALAMGAPAAVHIEGMPGMSLRVAVK